VNVGVKILRHVVVHDVRNALYVDTTGGDIGRDEDSVTPILKAVQRVLSLPLRKVSMKGCYVLSPLRELLRKALGGVLHLREYHDESLSILLEPVRQDVRL
jgi:hypothetical protein